MNAIGRRPTTTRTTIPASKNEPSRSRALSSLNEGLKRSFYFLGGWAQSVSLSLYGVRACVRRPVRSVSALLQTPSFPCTPIPRGERDKTTAEKIKKGGKEGGSECANEEKGIVLEGNDMMRLRPLGHDYNMSLVYHELFFEPMQIT